MNSWMIIVFFTVMSFLIVGAYKRTIKTWLLGIFNTEKTPKVKFKKFKDDNEKMKYNIERIKKRFAFRFSEEDATIVVSKKSPKAK